MDHGDTIAVAMAAVVLLAAVICVLYSRIRRSEAEDLAQISAGDPQIVQAFASAPAIFSSPTIEEIHRKYDDMAEVDPIRAGKLKYAELLRHHGE